MLPLTTYMMKNETKYVTERYCKERPDTVKEIILNSLKLAQLIYERTGNCVRVISTDRGSYGPDLGKKKKKKKRRGAFKGRER